MRRVRCTLAVLAYQEIETAFSPLLVCTRARPRGGPRPARVGPTAAPADRAAFESVPLRAAAPGVVAAAVQCCIPQKACHGDTAASARLQQPPGGPVATVIQPGPSAWPGRRHTGASSRHQCTQSPTILCARLSRRQRQRLAAGDRHQLQQPAASVPVAAGATGATAGGPFDGWL